MFVFCVICFALAVFQGAHGVSIDLAPYNTSAVIGANATLACLVSNQGNEGVLWYAPGNLNALSVDGRVTATGTHYEIHGQYNLSVINVQLADQGEYKCAVGTQNYFGSLTVVDLPSNVTVYWGSAPVSGGLSNLTCYASRSHPPATLTWFKNNVPLDTNAAYIANTDSSGYGEAYSFLPVRLTPSDAGAIFRCEAGYPDFSNAVNANLTTVFSARGGSGNVSGEDSSKGCNSLCNTTANAEQMWKDRLSPTIAFWFYSTCGVQSCPDFASIADDVAALMRKQLCV